MNDIVIGVRLTGDAKGLVGEVRLSRQEIAGLTRDTDAGRKAATAARQAAEDYAKALKKQYDTVGMTAAQVKKYEIAQLAATAAEKQAMVATVDATEALRRKLEVAEKIGRTLGGLITTAIQAGAAMAAVVTQQSIKAAMEAEQSHARLGAVLKATGHAAGLTAADVERIVDELTELSKFDDESIRNAAGSLLMFKNVGRESFGDVLKMATDLAAFMGTDLNSAVLMLGRALEDPANGLTQIQRATRAFSDEQREAIKEMAESGRQAEAMNSILDALKAKGIDGVAEAMNSGLSKAYSDNKKALNELLETMGQTDAIGGNARRFFEGLTSIMRDLQGEIDGTSAKFSRFFKSEEFLGSPLYNALRGLGMDDPYQANAREKPRGPKPSTHAEDMAAQDARAEEGQKRIKAAREAAAKAAQEQADKEAAAYAKIVQAAEGYITGLQRQLQAEGATTEQKIMLEAATKAMTLATEAERVAYLNRAKEVAHAIQLAQDEAALKRELARIDKDYEQTTRRHAEALGKSLDAQRDHLKQLEEEARLFGLTAEEVEKLTLARMEQQLAQMESVEGAEKEIEVLKKRIDLQRRIVEQTGINEGLKRQADLWGDVADRVSDVGARMVLAAAQGKNALEILIDEVRNLAAELLALTIKKWFIQIVAGATGNPILAGAANQVGGNTLSGAVMQGATSWLGNTAWGGAISRGFEGFSMGWQSGMAAPNAGWAEQAGAWASGNMGTIATYLSIIAGMVMSMVRFDQGWRVDNDQDWGGSRWEHSPMVAPVRWGDSILRGLGFNDRWAAILSGSSAMTRFWGHGPRHDDAFGISGNFSGRMMNAAGYQEWSRRGGYFRSDRREVDRDLDLDPSQQRFLSAFMGAINSTIGSLARRVGVNADTALAGYSRDFSYQLSNNGEPLSEEELREIFSQLFAEVLRDQVAVIMDEAGYDAAATYLREFEGTAEEIEAVTRAFIGLVDDLESIDRTIEELEGGPMAAFTNGLEDMQTRITDAQTAFEEALAGGDPQEVLAAERELRAAVMDRYNAEINMIRQLQQAIDQLEQQAYEFSIAIAQRINAVGGSRDIGAIALGRATDLRGQIGGTVNPGRQMQFLQQYVGAIDQWYNARRSQIERDIQQQAAAFAAWQAGQQAAYAARISALEYELQLVEQWKGVLERTSQIIDEMRLTDINPLHARGRLELARGDAETARQAYLSATGGDRVTAANRYLDALQRQLGLLGESYQRPSPEYQEIYNEIIRQLTEVQGVAQTESERSIELQQQLANLQGEANAIASMTFDVNSLMSAAMEELNREALGYYTYAEEEGRRLFALQIQQHQEQLDAITGGMEPELYIAARTAELVDLFREVRDDIRDFMRAVTAPPPGGGEREGDRQPPGGPNGSRTGDRDKVVLQLDGKVLGEVLMPHVARYVTGPLMPAVKRGLAKV